jgi:hypothetical protein
LLPAFEQAALALHRQGLIAERSGCPPLLGVDRRELTPRLDVTCHNCRPFNDAVAAIVAKASIREVVLASRWTKNVEGTDYAVSENRVIFLKGLRRTLDFLMQAQKKIVIVGPIPEIGTSVPEVLARAKYFRIKQDVRPTIAEFNARQEFILKTFAHLQPSDDITVVYPDHALCAVDKCAVEKAGSPLYRNSHHLSTFGAQQLTALISSVL